MSPSPIGSAWDIEFDAGQNRDLIQILGPGGGVLQGNQLNGLIYGSVCGQDNITAHPGGGQALAVPVTSYMMRITVVASAGDSIILPPSLRGYQVALLNDAVANAANIYPTLGETINGGAPNAPFSLAAQNGAGTGPTIFYCFTAGSWRTK